MPAPFPYTQFLGDIICERIASGESLRAICSEPDFPTMPTVFKWLDTTPGFVEQYVRAREVQAETLAYQALEIADTQQRGVRRTVKPNGDVEEVEEDMLGHRRLQIDQRRWMAGKLKPKVYGDKLDLNHSGSIDVRIRDMTDDELLAAVQELVNSGTLTIPGDDDLEMDEGEEFVSDLA